MDDEASGRQSMPPGLPRQQRAFALRSVASLSSRFVFEVKGCVVQKPEHHWVNPVAKLNNIRFRTDLIRVQSLPEW